MRPALAKGATRAYVWFTPEEARELRETLDQMLAANDPGWHGHVSAVDYETEITLAVDRA